MAGVYSDLTRISTPNKEWKGKIAYDKTKDANKVRALQTLLYGSSVANAKYNANIDGKWGANTLRRFNNAGFTMADDWNSYTDKSGNVYTWNGSTFAAAPKQKSGEDELWYLLSDSRQREAQNWINRQNAAGRNVGIVDWFAMNEANSHSLENAIKAGTIQAEFVRDLMAGIAGTEAFGALAKTAGPLVGKAILGLGNGVKSGLSAANEAIERGVYQTSRLFTEPGKVALDVRGAAQNAGRSAKQLTSKTKAAGLRAVGTVRSAGQKMGNDITSSYKQVLLKVGDAVTPKPTKFEMAPSTRGALPAEEFIHPSANMSAGSRPSYSGPVPHQYLGTIRPEVFDWQTAFRLGGKFQVGGTVQSAEQQQMIQAFAEWGAKKYGQGQMSPEQFLMQVQKLDKKQQQALIQEFQAERQGGQQAVAAKFGAKLNYIKNLKGDCPDGQELVYFKKGGRFCKACQDKKQKGGNIDEVANFKKNREEKKCGGGKMKK